jgi:hypothetical protein
MAAILDMVLHSLIEEDCYLRGAYCLHNQGNE